MIYSMITNQKKNDEDIKRSLLKVYETPFKDKGRYVLHNYEFGMPIME